MKKKPGKVDMPALNVIDGGIGVLGLGNAALSQWSFYGSSFIGPAIAYYGALRLMIDASSGERRQIQSNIMNNGVLSSGCCKKFARGFQNPGGCSTVFKPHPFYFLSI